MSKLSEALDVTPQANRKTACPGFSPLTAIWFEYLGAAVFW